MARAPELMNACEKHNPEALTTESLTLEEIFVATFEDVAGC